MEGLFDTLKKEFGRVDILVHSIATALREELAGRPSDVSLEGYLLAQQVSAYSLIELTRRARPLMEGGGSIIALTFIGSQRTTPNYNVMGPAKAALEASVRYLARELGPENIRCNAVSAGALRVSVAKIHRDESRAQTLHLFLDGRPRVEGFDDGAQTLGRRDSLQPRDPRAQDEHPGGCEGPSRRHHHGHHLGKPVRGEQDGLVTAHRAHRRKHVHALCTTYSWYKLHRKRLNLFGG